MNAKPSPVNLLLESSNQRPYEFRLDNTAFDPSAEHVIYRERAAGDANILVLTLTNSSEQAFKLSGGDMPASNNSVPETAPTTLFLTFGDKQLTESLSLDSLAVEVSTDGSTWTAVSQPESGWRFARFNANKPNSTPYVGLCPQKDFDLGSKASVKFRFAKLRCTYAGTSSQQLRIGCYNLTGDPLDSYLRLYVVDPPTYLSPFSGVFTPSITSRTVPHEWTSGNAEVLVTPDAVLDAVHDRLVNELKLTFSYTGTESAGVDLAQSSLTLTFVAGTKYDTGALTTESDISNITYQIPDGWKVEKQDGTDNTPTGWLIKPPDNMTLTKLRPVEIIFTNIKIGQGFPVGLTYVSLINRNMKGYRDGHFSLPVSRATAKASITDFRLSTTDPSRGAAISYLRGADQLVDFNSKVYLSWKAFAVPYLQLEYQTLDDKANLTTQYVEYDKPEGDRTQSCDSFSIQNIKADTGFILRGYNTRPGNTQIPDHADEDPAKRKPLVQATSMTSIRVKHAQPVIEFFRVTCSPKKALVSWSVKFGELDSWLTVQILNQKRVTVYTPQTPEKRTGKCWLEPPDNSVFDEDTKFHLQAWNSQLQTERPTIECRLDLIKYFTGKPRSPQVLGSATIDFDLEVKFSQLTECYVVQGPGNNIIFNAPEDKQHPGRKLSGKYPVFSAQNIATGATFHVRASGAEARERIEYHAEINEESVRNFVLRKRAINGVVRRFHPEGYENKSQYSHDVGQYIEILGDGRAQYIVNMGALVSGERNIVAVQYLSSGSCDQDKSDGHYYFQFDGTNRQIIPPSGDMRGNLYEYGLGWYRVVTVKPFRYRITSEGLQGGPNWCEDGIEVGFSGYGGWWKSRPEDKNTGNTFTWA